jgi:hypothetical protein
MNISAIPSNIPTMTAPLTMRNFQPDIERTNSLKEAGLSAGAT